VKYIICKTSHEISGVSYSGSAWDSAGIRNLYQPSYRSKDWALRIAKFLTKHNPVGFHVVEVSETPPIAPR
jgi:hypothetical protein